MVFQELGATQQKKVKNRGDLESELFGGSDFGGSVSSIRDNEGEAAEYGVYFDDTEYDYMQHMRDLDGGDGSGESYFVEAPTRRQKNKGKAKISLEDALRNASITEDPSDGPSVKAPPLLDPDLLPSRNLRKITYENQQDVPDAIAGFQPDMDPRLREVLEALEDEAYVDDEEELFNEITKDNEELTLADFVDMGLALDDVDEGWQSDHTAKPDNEYKASSREPPFVPLASDVPMDETMDETMDHGDGDWMAEFSKAKHAAKPAAQKKSYALSNADIQSSILSGLSTTSKRKRRKGALTSESGYSMSSASLARTEALTLLDARFDKIEEEYADDMDMDNDEDGGASVMSGAALSTTSKLSTASKASTNSQAPSLVNNPAFDGMMDEFLNGYSMSGKKRVKKGRYQSGMEQLDEIRRELGRPRVGLQRAS